MRQRSTIELINEMVKNDGLRIDDEYDFMGEIFNGLENPTKEEKLEYLLNKGEEMKIVFVAPFIEKLKIKDNYKKMPVAALREIAVGVDERRKTLVVEDLFDYPNCETDERYMDLRYKCKRYILRNKLYYIENDQEFKVTALFDENQAAEKMISKLWEERERFINECNKSEELKKLYVELLEVIQ